MDDKSLRGYVAELVGTFGLVFISAAAVYVSYLNGFLFVNELDSIRATSATVYISLGLAAGLVYAAALAVTLPLAGGFLNPAVVITLWVFRRLDGVRTIALLAVQVLGAVLAGLALWALLGFRSDLVAASHLGAPQFNANDFGYGKAGGTIIPLLQGVAIELGLTFLLTFVIFGTAVDPRARVWFGSWAYRLAPLWIGLMLGAATAVGFPLTGAALNPARWLGPALWESVRSSRDAYAHNAVFWVGPIAGALLAGWVYTALILPAEEEQRVSPAVSMSAAGATSTSSLARAKR